MDRLEQRYYKKRHDMLLNDRVENIGSFSFLDRMKKMSNLVDVDHTLLSELFGKYGTSAHGLTHFVVFDTEAKDSVETIFFLANTNARANQPLAPGGKVSIAYELRFEGSGIGLVMYNNKLIMMRLALLNGKASRIRAKLDIANSASIKSRGVSELQRDMAAAKNNF